MKMIEILKQRCTDLLAKTNDEKKIKILNLVSQILNKENSLKKMDVQVVLNILIDLEYTNKEIPKIYSKIVKED